MAPSPQRSVVDLAQVRRDVEALARARILFGHQSVGNNILAGVRGLAAEAGASLPITVIDAEIPGEAPGLSHLRIGRNGDPDSKCRAFQASLAGPYRPRFDLALMKFCYVDLKQGSRMTPAALAERYSALIEELRKQRPDVRIVHVTMPVVATPTGIKARVKRLVGRTTDEDADNVLRCRFNDELRARFGSEPLFDLAAAESTYPDGSRSTSSARDGAAAGYSLARLYTDDGGHLNPVGQRLLGAAFVRALAAALR